MKKLFSLFILFSMGLCAYSSTPINIDLPVYSNQSSGVKQPQQAVNVYDMQDYRMLPQEPKGIYHQTRTMKVPDGTSITLNVENTITSDNPNTTVKAVITDDVVIDGITIFKSGGKATVTVVDYDKAGGFGTGGKLVVANGYVYDVKGNKHKILLSKIIEGKSKNWVRVTFCCGILIWPLLLVGFVHGNEAKLMPNIELDGTLAGNFEF